MRVLRRVGYLFAALVFLSGCAGIGPAGGGGPSLGLSTPPWQSGKTVSYQWLDQSGAQVGAATFSFSLSSSEWTIQETNRMDQVDQAAAVTLNGSTLRPLGVEKTITTTHGVTQYTAEYKDGYVAIEAHADGGSQSDIVDLPDNALDSDQFLMTLRALPFAEGYSAEYTVVVVQDKLLVDTSVRVQRQESVQVPAGTFSTWRVTLESAQGTRSAWYQVDAPFTLVQVISGTDRLVLTGP